MDKKCTNCNETKSTDEFQRNKKKKDGFQSWCRACQNSWNNKSQKIRRSTIEGKQKYNEYMRQFAWNRKKIGVNPSEYDRKFFEQKGCCAICNRHQSEFNMSLAVDHDHETGQVRGLLCVNCNLFVGRLEKEENIAKKAESYLVSWKMKSNSA